MQSSALTAWCIKEYCWDSHSREVEHDGVQYGLCEVLQVFVVAGLRARVIPGPVAEADLAHVHAAAHVSLDVIDKRVIEEGRVRVENALFEAVVKLIEGRDISCVVRAKSDAHFASVFGAGTTCAGVELFAGQAKHDLFEYRTTGFTTIV